MHKELEQKYKDANFEYNIDLHPNDKNEFVFFEKAKLAKKPVTHEIIKVVRVKTGVDEYVYYHEILRSKDFLDNLIDHSRIVGKYDDPQFSSTIDPQTRTPRATEIQGYETKYDISWTPNIIDIWQSQEGFKLDDNCGYIVKQGGKVYGGYTQEQFCSLSFEDLVTLGKYGTLEPAGIQKEIRKRNKQLAGQVT